MKIHLARLLLILLISSYGNCISGFAAVMSGTPHGGTNSVTVETVLLFVDEGIAYPIIIGVTAPSFGWIFGGTDLGRLSFSGIQRPVSRPITFI